MADKKIKGIEISPGEEFRKVTLKGQDLNFEVSADGTKVEIVSKGRPIEMILSGVNNKTMTAMVATQNAIRVGDWMDDHTICFDVDRETNTAWFVPENIFFGDEVLFNEQNTVVEAANKKNLYGHNDWQKITGDKGDKLAKAWDKVAGVEYNGKDGGPWFWANPDYHRYGGPELCRGGVAEARDSHGADYSNRSGIQRRPVPIVRSGSATLNPK